MQKPNLDFMRAVAVTTVLIDHTTLQKDVHYYHGWNLGSLGVFGVYLFFVHTCLVLMWSLERRPHTLDFYVRRVFRIYPLAIVTVLIIALFHLPFTKEPLVLTTVVSNILLVQDLWPHPNVVGTLWSLPLEVDMYLVLPMLFVFARKEKTVWPFLLLWLFAAQVSRSLFGKHSGNSLIGVVPHFLPGIMAYVRYKKTKPVLPAWSFPLFLLVACAYFENFPVIERGWCVCLTLGLLLPLFHELRNRSVIAISHQVAKYSYGIYLLHPFCLMLGFGVLKNQSLPIQLATSAITLAISAYAAYHLIEHPAVKLGNRCAALLQTHSEELELA